MRPVLSPAARRLWRDPETLQLGQAPGRSAVLCGLDPATRQALGLMDGTRDRAQVLAAAAAVGCPPSRTSDLLDLLAGAGLLEDAGADLGPLAALERAERERLAADLASLALVRGDGGLPAAAHRADARVLVIGAGRVGAPARGPARRSRGRQRRRARRGGRHPLRTPASAARGSTTSAGAAGTWPASGCCAALLPPPRDRWRGSTSW